MAETANYRLDALVVRVKKVRRWLVTLAVLRVAALCLIFVSAYIGAYAWLDHRLNFGQVGRIAALILLIAGLALLLHRLTKLLLGHISCSAAANYIENKQNFDQQLVTAIEYYENKQNYPYSSALAEQLVLQVEKDSAEYQFDAAVQKWQGYVLGAIIIFGLVVTWFYVKDNYIYFASYFARLIRPTASVEALSPTHLEPITKDLVAEPDSEVNFAAEIEGRVPEFAKLVMVSLEPQSKEDVGERQGEQVPAQIKPAHDNGPKARMEASRSFSQPGQFKYRFEAGSTSTPWHNLTISPAPDIESMTAQVTMPRKSPGRAKAKSYTEQIENNTLEVLPGSNISLNVQATDKLNKVVATDLDGNPMTKSLDGTKQFTYHFTANKSGSVRFDLVNEQGLPNNDLPGLEVIVKTDEPPKFELISPDGDYLATDVASVPVTFEVTDDFGLESLEMCLEIPGQKPAKLTIPVEEGIRSKTFTHMIELEEHNLSIGDSILFHAKAMDIDTGSTPANRTSSSEVYFIEIRPYRQNWRSKSGGPSPSGLPAPVELLNILEYTRAIVKKTWAIAEKPSFTDQDHSGLESIDNDIRYCAEQLTLIRDDSDYGWQEPHKAVLNAILGYYQQASQYLVGDDAVSAMAPEKNAYRILRKFILESDLQLNPPQSGQSPQVEKPDSVKLQERPPEYTEMEGERIESELQQMQQKLDKLTKEQETLKRTFKKFLQQQAENKKSAQKATSQEASDTTAGEQGQDKAPKDQQGQASPGQQEGEPSGEQNDSQSTTGGQSGPQGQTSSESKNASGIPSTDKKQNNAENQQAQTSPGQQGEQSSADQESKDSQSADGNQSGSKGQASLENMRAMESPDSNNKGNDTQGQGKSESQTPGESKNASSGSSPGEGEQSSEGQDENQTYGGSSSSMANTDLRLRMLQAKQKALQDQVSQLKRDLQELPQTSQSNSNEERAQAQKHLDEAIEKMDDFQSKLTESRYQANMDMRQSSEALETMEAAKRQMDLAQKAIVNELTWTDDQRMANEAEEMAEQLVADADAFDESVSEAEREDMLARLEAAKRLLEMMPEPQWAQVGRGKRNPSSPVAVLTKNPNMAPAEAARQMARQFWSIALNEKKRQQPLVEDESSDVTFYRQENEFFENAAKFKPEPTQK